MTPAQIAKLTQLELPSSVSVDDKKSLVIRQRKIPIVTNSLTEEDGFYFMEPSLNDLIILRDKLVELSPTDTEEERYEIIVKYLVEKMTNVEYSEDTGCSLMDEVETFISHKIYRGFFFSQILKFTQSIKPTNDTTGITEESE